MQVFALFHNIRPLAVAIWPFLTVPGPPLTPRLCALLLLATRNVFVQEERNVF